MCSLNNNLLELTKHLSEELNKKIIKQYVCSIDNVTIDLIDLVSESYTSHRIKYEIDAINYEFYLNYINDSKVYVSNMVCSSYHNPYFELRIEWRVSTYNSEVGDIMFNVISFDMSEIDCINRIIDLMYKVISIEY